MILTFFEVRGVLGADDEFSPWAPEPTDGGPPSKESSSSMSGSTLDSKGEATDYKYKIISDINIFKMQIIILSNFQFITHFFIK